MTVTHRMSGTRTHTSWRKMRERCTNPRSRQWPWYGARGIKVCPRWDVFENFYADMGARPAGMTLDRKDGDGDYTPDNCRWATPRQQARGQAKTLRADGRAVSEIAQELDVHTDTLTQRIRKGIPAGEALDTADRRNPVTTDELATFDAHLLTGFSQREIAAAMQVKPRRVERMARMRREGLPGWATNHIARATQGMAANRPHNPPATPTQGETQ